MALLDIFLMSLRSSALTTSSSTSWVVTLEVWPSDSEAVPEDVTDDLRPILGELLLDRKGLEDAGVEGLAREEGKRESGSMK